MENGKLNAQAIDWVITGVFLLLLTLGGVACRYFIKNVAGWTVAGRHMRKYLGLSTGTAEGMAIISIALGCEQGFTNGFLFVSNSIITLLVVMVIYGMFGFVVQRYREAGVVTVPEYAERRYSKGVRIAAASVLAVSGILNLAIFPIMASQFLAEFLNAPETIEFAGLAIPFVPALMAMLIGLALVFTYAGGMVAVILTDFVQSVLIAVMVFVITFLVIKDVGFSGIHETVTENLGERGYNPFLGGAGHEYGTLFIVWMVFGQILGYPAFAPTMQKIAATDTVKTARQMVFISALFGQGRMLMIILWGIAALAVMGSVPPEGMEQGMYHKVVGARYISQLIMPVGLGLFGIAIAGMLAAFITTVDSYFLTWSTMVVNDVIVPLSPGMSQRRHLWYLRLVVSLIAVFLFVFGVMYKPSESIMVYVSVTGSMMLGAAILLIGGLYWRRASTPAAYAALVSCCALPLIDLILRRVLGDDYPVRPQEAGMGGIVLAMALFALLSCLFPNRAGETEEGVAS